GGRSGSGPEGGVLLEGATARTPNQRRGELLLDSIGGDARHLPQELGLAGLQQGHRLLCRAIRASIEDVENARGERVRERAIARPGRIWRRSGDGLALRAPLGPCTRHRDRAFEPLRMGETRHEEQESRYEG